MKIQCSCGTKYSFEVTPEMAQNPVRFVCPNCGLDSSEYVNQLVREELAEQAASQPATVASVPPLAPRLKISHEAKPPEPPPVATASNKYCEKHRTVPATGKCSVCGKPICPQCMELFGYFCSSLCKNKADLQGVAAPVYAGTKNKAEARFWRRAGLIFGSVVAVMVFAVGFWVWYEWIGSMPHPQLSVPFDDTDRAYFGASQLAGKDQIVFLHGGTLARYDLNTKKQIWLRELITKEQIADMVKVENDLRSRFNLSGEYNRNPPAGTPERLAKIALQGALSLQVSGRNIWVANADTLTHYDWDSGKALRVISLPERGGELVKNGDELLVAGAQSVTHVNLDSGDSRVEQFGAASEIAAAPAPKRDVAGLPDTATGQPLEPRKIEAQTQNLNLPARIALPALVANASYEQQIEAALNDDLQRPYFNNSQPQPTHGETFRLVPGQSGVVQFFTRLLEEHSVTRSAMKEPPGKSAVNGDLNGGNQLAANEILNDMQRERGGGTVTEDQSLYQVTVHLPDSNGTADWTGEVVGPAQLFVLKTVNVIAAGKTVIVLDKSNKKLWQASLTYNVSVGDGGITGRSSKYGEGPVVEHGDTLYVIDQAVLSAYDLATGNARWRLPSVGVVGLFFDDQGSVYVNTTTGNPDDIKYSRQIDISRNRDAVLFKLDAATGKTLWTIKPENDSAFIYGYIAYVSGKYIYTIESFDPIPTDARDWNELTDDALTKRAHLRIVRIRPSDGKLMWEHFQYRCPVNVRFNENTIQLVFKKEVQVLHYLSL
jgi:hypothetical protein